MASAGHRALSDFIKSVHQNLRDNSKEIGTEQAWQEHCRDKENLKKYAQAMQELACQYWEQNVESTSNSRIQWTVNACRHYFINDINKFRDKENSICMKIDNTFTLIDLYDLPNMHKLKLLDVGSCYNPFNNLDLFEVTAIDIAPAKDEVITCDFMSVRVAETLTVKNNELCELPESHFNIVVFSLFLEYLPSPRQRFACCEKAYKLLKEEGLLIVITPDSNHVGVNAKYMKSWRYILAKIGFSRIKYEKLSHIHCMAFRKAVHKTVAIRWAELHEDKNLFEEMYIPQDFNKCEQLEDISNSEENICDSENNITTSPCTNFSEFPVFDIFQ